MLSSLVRWVNVQLSVGVILAVLAVTVVLAILSKIRRPWEIMV